MNTNSFSSPECLQTWNELKQKSGGKKGYLTKTQKSDEGKSILVDGGQPFVPCSTNTEDKLNQGKGSFNI